MSDYLDSHWPPPLSFVSARRRRYAIVNPIVLIGMLSHLHPGSPPDRGIAACTSLSGLNQAGVPDFRRLRAEFATSQWPNLRADGTTYADLAIKLRTARTPTGLRRSGSTSGYPTPAQSIEQGERKLARTHTST
jgi:hypothetical protein